MPKRIQDAWGDWIEPGEGEGTNWQDLDMLDRAEDLQQVYNRTRSFGMQKDQYIHKIVNMMNGDFNKAADYMADEMKNGKLPGWKMWESPNTKQERYNR